MRIRSAVTALGATLALAIMLTTTTTPAVAARPTEKHTKPPSVVEMQDNKPKGEQGRSQLTSTMTSSKQELPRTPPGSSTSAVTSEPVYQQGTASVASNGGNTVNGGSNSNGYGNSNGAPMLPSGSIIPSSMTTPTYQQGPGSSVNLINPGPQSQTTTDVRVVYVNSAWNSNSTIYHFRVENASAQPATGISLSSVVREQSGTSNAARRVEEQYPRIASLAAGQAQDVVVTCTPQAGFQCVSGALDAFVANDLNPANNGAHS